MQRSTPLATLVLLSLAAPAALAGWGSMGQYEPDTVLDITGNWMHEEPNWGPGNKVYFNGFLGEYPLTAVNPGAATLRTGTNAPFWAHFAMFGVWKDCNKDGFVGYGDQGLLEYRVELLNTTGVCAANTNIPTKIPMDWIPPHNDGAWVHELLPIAWTNVSSVTGDQNPWNLNDNEARVWFDEGRPTDDLSGEENVGGGCIINQQPIGTYRSTGGLLKWADCHTGFTITDAIITLSEGSSTCATPPTFEEECVDVTGLDELGVGQFSFGDAPRDQDHSASTLNQKNPWGHESDASAAQAWDCSSDPIASVPLGEPPAASGRAWLNVSQPSTSPDTNTGGSAAGTANATGAGFDECDRNTRADGNTHPGDALAHAPYGNEGGQAENDITSKTMTANLEPFEATRPPAPWALALGRGTPANFGVPHGGAWDLSYVDASSDGYWASFDNTIEGPKSASYTTAYASVSSVAIAKYSLILPSGAATTGTYGSEACGTATTGIRKGWQCEAAKWYRDTNGADIQPRAHPITKDPLGVGIGARVGWKYNLRDTDCYDQSAIVLRQAGISWTTVEQGLNEAIALERQALYAARATAYDVSGGATPHPGAAPGGAAQAAACGTAL